MSGLLTPQYLAKEPLLLTLPLDHGMLICCHIRVQSYHTLKEGIRHSLTVPQHSSNLGATESA